MSRFSRKSKVIAAAVLLTVSVSGVAFAYWTSTGSGSATGTNAAGTGTVTITGTVASGLAPGLSRTVSFTAANPATNAIKIGTISDTAIDSNIAGCDTLIADFSMADVVADQVIPAGATAEPITATGSLAYANTAVNQDACKGAVITLTLSATAAA